MSNHLKTDPLEIQRRQQVTKNALQTTPMALDAVNPHLEFNDPSQGYAVVNLANPNLRPKSVSPALRVMGVFPSVQLAVEFGRSLAPTIPSCNIYIVETCKWNLIPQSTERTPEQCMQKVEDLLLAHYKNIVLSKIEFDNRRNQNPDKQVLDENVFKNPSYTLAMNELQLRNISIESLQPEVEARAEAGKTELFNKVKAAKEQEAKIRDIVLEDGGSEHKDGGSEHKDGGGEQSQSQATPQPAAHVDAVKVDWNNPILNAENDFVDPLPTQKYFLVSFIQDATEPAYCIFAALPTMQECKGYDYNVLRLRVPDHDVTYADTGKWLYPEASLELDKNGLATRRLDEQNRIMDFNRMNKNISHEHQDGMTIEADMVLDEQGNIVPLNAREPCDEEKEIKN
jgi:hypothetical protein